MSIHRGGPSESVRHGPPRLPKPVGRMRPVAPRPEHPLPRSLAPHQYYVKWVPQPRFSCVSSAARWRFRDVTEAPQTTEIRPIHGDVDGEIDGTGGVDAAGELEATGLPLPLFLVLSRVAS